jgi:hypothetical protein
MREDMEAAMDAVEEASPELEVVDEVEAATTKKTTEEAEEAVSTEAEPTVEEPEVEAAADGEQ